MIQEYLTKVQEQDKKDELDSKIIKFLKDNPNPPDADIHALANDLGIY